MTLRMVLTLIYTTTVLRMTIFECHMGAVVSHMNGKIRQNALLPVVLVRRGGSHNF